MNRISLNEDERNVISKEIANIVQNLKQNEDPECIYLLSYKGEKPSCIQGNVLELIIKTSEKINESKCDVSYYFNTEDDQPLYLVTTVLKKSEDLIEDNLLFNSTILYDKTGKYIKAKEKMEKEYEEGTNYIYIPYGNLLDIEPPINDKIKEEIIKLDKKQKLVMTRSKKKVEE